MVYDMRPNTDFTEFLRAQRYEGSEHNLHQDLTDFLKNGDSAALEALDWEKYCTDGVGTMSHDPITQYRILVVVAATMGGIYAIEAGVDPDVSLFLSDYYIQQSQMVSKIDDLIQMVGSCLIHFSKFIAQQKTAPHSTTVRHAVAYIGNHIFQPIMVGDIAEALHISDSYLSKRFRDEMGITVKDYIHTEKLREARNLMKYTSMNLTQIADMLGYSDSSHFSKICKTYEGCTPKELKSRIAKE